MKRIFLLIALCSVLFGCAFLTEKKLDAKACISDPACFDAATAKAKDLGIRAGDLASLSGIPAAPSVAKPVVSYVSLLVFLCAMGATLRKKENV